MSHHNDIKLLPLLAVSLMCLCSLAIIDTGQEDLDAISTGSSSSPLTSLSFDVNDIASGTTFYVELGSSVNVVFSDNGPDTGIYNCSAVTSGFGISIKESGMLLSGTLSKVGTVMVSYIVQYSSHSDNWYFEIEVVASSTSVTGVTITGSSTVNVGSTLTLTATTTPDDASERGVTWSITSGSSYVSYTTTTTSTGGTIKLTGLSAGSVTVKATASDGSGKYATKTITVNQPTYKYYLYYDMNGGSGGPSDQYETATDTTSTVTTQISTVEPTRSGYTFLGWATTSTATKATYSPGDYVNITYDDLTLYAVWKANSVTYTLSFSANGGSGAPSSMSGTTTSTSYTFTIPATEPARSGYTFKGWSTSSSATSASYTSGNTITISSNTTLYAVWYQNLSATSTPSVSGVVGQQYSYTVSTNVAGCTISVSGASWLSVSGTTVSGVPTSPGTYDITITIIKSGSYISGTQSFTLKVYSAMGFESVPSASGIFAYAM